MKTIMENNTITYLVQEVTPEADDVVTLHLRPLQNVIPSYKAGQFITVFFPETGHKEGKSYSLSSSPNESGMSITVRGVGTFSNKLIAKKVGDTINGSLPYGYFYSESEANSMILVAGGIGIAPLMSMIKYSRKMFPVRKIILLFSNKTLKHIIFRNELNELSRQSDGNFIVEYYLTQEVPKMEEKKGRIPVSDIFKCYEGFTDSELFICGSIEFVRDYWRGLKGAGVPVEKIYTEAFF
jgi:ferredoxin-NADP reductase